VRTLLPIRRSEKFALPSSLGSASALFANLNFPASPSPISERRMRPRRETRWHRRRRLDFVRSNRVGVFVDRVHREPAAAFTGETLDHLGVSSARSAHATDPVVDRGGLDVELQGERFHAVGLDEAGKFGLPTSVATTRGLPKRFPYAASTVKVIFSNR
jgi:hypothetical protein